MSEYPQVNPEIIDPVSENLKQLASLFPAAVKDGQLDVEALKAELGQFEEVGDEKYQLNWPGKQAAKQKAFEKPAGRTLKFVPEESKNPETTGNIFIEGDNLEALQLLRKNYYGAIKMIYIDPPYNTGKDFVYKDNFKMSQAESDQAEGNVTEDGERLVKNSKDSGRYHSNWLNMMYPRLKIARELLKEDGVIFISIDDNEVSNLRKLCDEVFGLDNFLACMVLLTGANQSGDGVKIQTNTENCLVYSKSSQVVINRVDKVEESLRSLSDAPTPLETRPDMGYSIYYNPETGDFLPKKDYDKSKINLNSIEKVYADDPLLLSEGYIPIRPGMRNNKLHRWRWGFDTFIERKDEVVINHSGNKYLISFKQSGFNSPKNILQFGSGTTEVKNLFDGNKIFDFPKNVAYLQRLITIGITDGDIILDFFAGSATTAHAVMQLNAEDGGTRKSIMVQLPEACDEKSEAFKFLEREGTPTNIAEISKERIRRAGEKIKAENADKEGIENLDVGFKVFKTGDTNINWLKADLQGNDLFEDVYKNASDKDKLDFTPSATDLDVVYEIMLRQADVPLSATVEKLDAIGERTYLFADSYLVCLEEEITQSLVNDLAEIEPLPIKFVFRDSAFGDDIALKDKTFRTLSALIDRNTGDDKQTYTVEFI